MRPVVLRLESFSAVQERPVPLVTPMDVEDAYQRGHESGLAEGRERSLDALCIALTECRQDLASDRRHEIQLRQRILDSLVPVLHAIVEQLAPRANSGRLCRAIVAEMHRISKLAPEKQIILRCPADMHPELADCLELANLPQARIENAEPGHTLVELVTEQGGILFDPALVVTGLHSLIDDIRTED
jgi:hypothetical protein